MKGRTKLKHSTQTSLYPSLGVRFTQAYVNPHSAPLPREIFAGHVDILAAHDDFVALCRAFREHSATEARLRVEAKEAEQGYATATREALIAGKDPSKVVDRTPALLAEADRHAELYRQAKSAAEQAGARLGAAIAEAAPDLTGPAEATMAEAAEKVEAAVAALEAVWSTWAAAWEVRHALSQAWVTGSIPTFAGGGKLPAPVAAALSGLSDHVRQLDRLRADEEAIRAWRDEQAAAEAANSRIAAGNRIPASA